MEIQYEPKWQPAKGFRSQLEAAVAAELKAQSVIFRYEVEVVIDGRRIPYLPDFTIYGSCHEPGCDDWIASDVNVAALNETYPWEHLDLPQWVEAKPQEKLYSLRDELGVTRRVGERFSPDEDITVAGVTAAHLLDDELKKPKRLAEVAGESVLVIGGVGGSEMLTALMTPDSVVFSRGNRFVNSIGVARRKEREERRRYWEEQAERARLDSERRRREWEDAAAEREIAAAAGALERARSLARHQIRGVPRFSLECYGCQQMGTGGHLYRPMSADGRERWMRLCDACWSKAHA